MIGSGGMRYHERVIMLSVLDGLWKDHLLNMDHLKEGIGLRGYGQQDPLVAYKRESFDMFEQMMTRFQEDTVRYLYLMQIVGPDGKAIPLPTKPRGTVMDALEGPAAGEPPAALPQASAPAVQPSNGAPRRPGIMGGAASRPTSFVPARSTPTSFTPRKGAAGEPTTLNKVEQRYLKDKAKELGQAREEGGAENTSANGK